MRSNIRKAVRDLAWSVAHENLLKKMGREWDEYTGSMWNLPGYAVLGKSNEIAAMRFCYHQMAKHIHDYQSEDLEFSMDMSGLS